MTALDTPPDGGAFSRLSTGMKMLLILSTALLPMGIVALLASLQTAQADRASRETAVISLGRESAAKVNAAIARTALTLRTASTVLIDAPGPESCRHALESLAKAPESGLRFAIYTPDGRSVCAARGGPGWSGAPPAATTDPVLALTDNGEALRMTVSAADGRAVGVVKLPQAAIAAIAHPSTPDGNYRLTLEQNDLHMSLATMAANGIGRTLTVTAPIAGGQLALVLASVEPPVSPTEVLTVLLPILMWIAAAVIGWLVVDRLILKPLIQLQDAIDAYRAGDPRFTPPHLTTPAYEIRRLGDAFSGVAKTVASHEAELEEGIARQTRLTREVHHRVKNNLQVVSSLINLHARGASSAEVTAAYASIQRRVDALAVVHRNHYAELEENRGVALRPLIGEIAANLRAGAPPGAGNVAIGVAIGPFSAHQDVAVPVAFLLTELVEMSMLCAPDSDITIALTPGSAAGRAQLTVSSRAFMGAPCPDQAVLERFGRVVEGLSRQLRAKLIRDEAAGSIGIEIAVIPPVEDAKV